MTWTTRRLADFIRDLRVEDIPQSAKRAASRSILDLMGAAAAGFDSPLAQTVRRVSRNLFLPGDSGIWFTRNGLRGPGAAFVNSAAASALDIDDGHRLSGGHPGASVIPAALAEAGETGASGEELIASVILGYEIGVRIAAARDFSRQITMSTGRWCAYAAAATAGRLHGTDPPLLAETLAVAGIHSPDQAAAGYSRVEGNSVKEGIPWATLTGLTALRLARDGFTGPTDILDHPDFYDAEKILKGLGDSWAVEKTYTKPYACCRWIHSALDAFFDLTARNGLHPSEIHSVRVSTFERAARLTNYPDPDTLESAQYSIPFCLAAAAVEGKAALLPLKPALLARQDLAAFARKVEIRVDPNLDHLFPGKAPARVRIETDRGRFEKEVVDSFGDPENPLGEEALRGKFRDLTRPLLSAEQQEEIMSAVGAVESEGPERLFHLLKTTTITRSSGDIHENRNSERG